MPASPNKIKYNNEYNKRTWDVFTVRFRKGELQKYKDLAKKQDKSLNSFFIDAIDFYIASIK